MRIHPTIARASILTLLCGLFSGQVKAYEQSTHVLLTEEAQILIREHDPTGKYYELYPYGTVPSAGRSYAVAIQSGSFFEDAGGFYSDPNVPYPTARFGRHFYNPNSGSGLVLTLPIPGALPFHFRSALDWGRGDNILFGSQTDWQNPGSNINFLIFTTIDDGKNDRGWYQAIGEYHAGRPENGYLALGHVLHLIEDMCQPDHVHLREHRPNLYEPFIARDQNIGYPTGDFIRGLSSQLTPFTHASFTEFMNYTSSQTLASAPVPPVDMGTNVTPDQWRNISKPLLRQAVQQAAGLMQWYHDIVHTDATVVGGGDNELHTTRLEGPHPPCCPQPGWPPTIPYAIGPHYAQDARVVATGPFPEGTRIRAYAKVRRWDIQFPEFGICPNRHRERILVPLGPPTTISISMDGHGGPQAKTLFTNPKDMRLTRGDVDIYLELPGDNLSFKWNQDPLSFYFMGDPSFIQSSAGEPVLSASC